MDTLKNNIIPVVIVIVVIVAGLIGLFVYFQGKREAIKIADSRTTFETLEQLRQNQAELFMLYARRSGVAGGYDKETGGKLLKNFGHIMEKDFYYNQVFPDARLAIREHEPIFRDDRVSPGIRNILLEQYSKQLEEHEKHVAP